MEATLKEQLVRTMLRFKKMDLPLPPGVDIRMGEFFIMNGIAGNSGCFGEKADLSDIHSHLHITKPAVSQILNSLEKKQYVSREINTADRRKISVALTPRGKHVLTMSREYADEMLNLVISRFGEENMVRLIALLSLLADTFEAAGKEKSRNDVKGENELE